MTGTARRLTGVIEPRRGGKGQGLANAWSCGRCGVADNFAWRTTCRSCDTHAPRGGNGRSSRDFAAADKKAGAGDNRNGGKRAPPPTKPPTAGPGAMLLSALAEFKKQGIEMPSFLADSAEWVKQTREKEEQEKRAEKKIQKIIVY